MRMGDWKLKCLYIGLMLAIVALCVVPFVQADDPEPQGSKCVWDYRLNYTLNETNKSVSAWCDCINSPPCGYVQFYVSIDIKDFDGDIVAQWIDSLDEFEHEILNIPPSGYTVDIYSSSSSCGCGIGAGGGCGSCPQNPGQHIGPIEVPWYEVD